jgi:tRNA 5-methylaminomethyl-2-thiouridine biosynthesis bifunctional protein
VRERGVAGRADGLIRLETGDTDVAAMQHLLTRLMLPSDYVQAVSADDASRLSGLRLNTPAWFYPAGGWVAPSALARALLDQATALQGSGLRGGVEVTSLRRHGDEWQLTATDDTVLDQAPVVVWADGGSAFPQAGPPPWALDRVRGQTTLLAADTPGLMAPRLPIAGMGYVLPAIEGQVMCGATVQTADADATLQHGDQRQNLSQLQRLTGSNFDGETAPLAGRVGWRAVAGDRLPVIGGVPDMAAVASAHRRPDQARRVPRLAGLYVITGFASRGITWSALSAQTLASLITGAPCPLPADLLDAVDAARFVARATRAGHR